MGKPIGVEATDAHCDGINFKVLDVFHKMTRREVDAIREDGGIKAVRARCLEIMADGLRKTGPRTRFASATPEMFSEPSAHAIARRYGFDGKGPGDDSKAPGTEGGAE